MFNKHTLQNGITLVTERIRNVRSVCVGIWVKVGSRNEPSRHNGISHFLEHMLFKGTRKRSSAEIAISIDSLGGDLNAFTSKEGTAYYIKVLDEHLETGVDLLCDLFLRSTLMESEIEKEKGVIREEINMVEDTPDDYVHDLFSRNVWGNGGLGLPVAGSAESIGRFSREDLVSHVRRYYGAHETVIACAGNFEPNALVDTLNRKMGRFRKGLKLKPTEGPKFIPGLSAHGRDLSEAHICAGIQGIAQGSSDRYALLLLNSVLGGGVSSRLFQEIREKRGLVYSVYSFLSSYHDTGVWGIYAGVGPKGAAEVLQRSLHELRNLHSTITEAELKRAKDQIKGNLMLGLESTSRRMQSIANQEIYYGRHYSPREVIKSIEAVTLEEARALARRLTADDAVAVTVLGPLSGRKGALKPLEAALKP